MEDVVLLTDDEISKDSLFGETVGCAIVDSGCSRTVCGELWLNNYLGTLSKQDRFLIYSEPSNSKFRFGDGKVFISTKKLHLPVYIGNLKATLETEVVSCTVPLLLSRESMKKAHSHLDFQSDSLYIFGEKVPLITTQSGHYCLSLTRPLDHSQ